MALTHPTWADIHLKLPFVKINLLVMMKFYLQEEKLLGSETTLVEFVILPSNFDQNIVYPVKICRSQFFDHFQFLDPENLAIGCKSVK